jgi:hypothetical protein
MVEGLIKAATDSVTDLIMKVVVGFLAVVGALLIVFGLFYEHELWVLLGAIIIILALVVFAIIYILGLFGAVTEGVATVKDGVKTVREVKDLVDEVAPGAIPLVQKGVQRGLDAVTGKRPLFEPGPQQGSPQPQPVQEQPAQPQPVKPQPLPPEPVPPEAYVEPVHQPPAYQQPAYQQPAYQQPAYHQPPPPKPPAPPSVEADEEVYLPCPTCGAGNPPGVAYCHFCKHPFN